MWHRIVGVCRPCLICVRACVRAECSTSFVAPIGLRVDQVAFLVTTFEGSFEGSIADLCVGAEGCLCATLEEAVPCDCCTFATRVADVAHMQRSCHMLGGRAVDPISGGFRRTSAEMGLLHFSPVLSDSRRTWPWGCFLTNSCVRNYVTPPPREAQPLPSPRASAALFSSTGFPSRSPPFPRSAPAA